MTWKSASAYQTELWQIQHAKSTTIPRDTSGSTTNSFHVVFFSRSGPPPTTYLPPPLFCQFFENDFLLFHSPSIQFVGSWEIDVEPTDHSSRNLLFLSDKKKKSEEHRAEQHLSSKPPGSLLCIVQKGSTFANCSIFRQNDGPMQPVRSF